MMKTDDGKYVRTEDGSLQTADLNALSAYKKKKAQANSINNRIITLESKMDEILSLLKERH